MSLKSVQSESRARDAANSGPRTRYTPVSLSGVLSWNRMRNRAPEAPLCIEKEHRVIFVAANQTSLDAKNFRASYSKLTFDVGTCTATMRDILKSVHIHEMEMPNCKDFTEVINKMNIDAGIKKRQSFGELQMACDRAKVFDELVEATRERFHDCTQNHLYKYCVSFAQEMNSDQQIKAVADYEEKIRKTQATIEDKMREMDNLMVAYSDIKMLTMVRYLENEGEVRQIVENMTACINDICTLMKRWLHDDKTYSARLWDDIIANNVERGKLIGDQKKLARKRETIAHTVSKKQVVCEKTSQKLDEVRLERKKAKNSVEITSGRVETQENDQKAKRKNLEDNEFKIQNRKSNSPRYLDTLWLRSATLRTEIEKLQESIATNEKHLSRVQKEEQTHRHMCESTEKDLCMHELQLKTLKQQLSELDEEKDCLDKQLKDMEETIMTGKKIREMKLSGTTLRKIYFQKMDTSSQDKLMAACRIVARRLGRRCDKLYMELPFVPTRDRERRQRDLASVDRRATYRDRTPAEQAFDCLARWRLLHHRGNMAQLVRSLKRIEKLKLARHVEGLYLSLEQR